MGERVVLDLLGLLAQRVEFGQRRARGSAPGDKAAARIAERALKRRVGERGGGILP